MKCAINETGEHGNLTALNILNDEKAAIFTPVLVYLVVLMVIGIIGNSLVFHIYYFKFKKTSANYFITWLSVLDLISCFLGIPFEMYDLLNPYRFDLLIACKIMRFTSSATVLASGLTLVAVAFDRYYKIGQPLRRFPTKTAKILNACSLLLGALFATPALFVFGLRKVNIENRNETGCECSIDDKLKNTKYPMIYYVFLTALFFFCTTCFVVLYGKLGQTLITRKNSIIGEAIDEEKLAVRKDSDSDGVVKGSSFASRKFSNNSADHMANSPAAANGNHAIKPAARCDGYGEKRDKNNGQDREMKLIKNSGKNDLARVPSENTYKSGRVTKHQYKFNSAKRSSSKAKSHQALKRRKTGSISIRTGRVTSIFICVSCVFVISFLPYVVVKILSKTVTNFYVFSSSWIEVAYNFAVRSFFLNSAANPIIYSFLNETFRLQILLLFKRMRQNCLPDFTRCYGI